MKNSGKGGITPVTLYLNVVITTKVRSWTPAFAGVTTYFHASVVPHGAWVFPAKAGIQDSLDWMPDQSLPRTRSGIRQDIYLF